MAEEAQPIKINPHGCKGDAHACSLVQTVTLLSIFLQHPSEKVQNLKETLLEELEVYEREGVEDLTNRNRRISHIRKFVLQTILKDMVSSSPQCQPNVNILWEIMNKRSEPNRKLRKLFSIFKGVNKSVDLQKTFGAIKQLLANSEVGGCDAKTEEAFGKCMGVAKKYLLCRRAKCRVLWTHSFRQFPFFMKFEPPPVENFATSLETVVRTVLKDSLQDILVRKLRGDDSNCPWDLCNGLVGDQFAMDESFPEVFVAQINFIRDLEKEKQAIITKNEIIRVNGDNYAIIAKVLFYFSFFLFLFIYEKMIGRT